MSSGRGIIGTFTYGSLWHLMTPCSKGLAGPYIFSSLTESLVVSGQLFVIPFNRYALNLDVPVQYKCCCNYPAFLTPLTS